jgi:predicted ATP-dependent endonuclease of OLD family
MSSFTLLIGKNNSGKSNVAKALLLVSDYLESDSISEFPLNGTNSVYHKIEKYNELQTFLTDQNAAMSSYLNKENQPKITLQLTGGASFSILLKKGVENVEILVENVQLTDSNNNVIFKINILDIDIIEVFYSMKGIQDFLFNYKIQTNEVFGKKTDEEDLRQILNSQLQKKIKELSALQNATDRIRIQTDIDGLEKKIAILKTSQDQSLLITNNETVIINLNQPYLAKFKVLDLLLDFIPRKWSNLILNPNDDDNSNEDSFAPILEYDENQPEYNERLNRLEKVYREQTSNIAKYLVSNLDTINFSPVNRYSPFREYIDTAVFTQMNNVDIIKDISTLLAKSEEFSLRAEEKAFLNRWLIEFGISDGSMDQELLKIKRSSNLGFSINVFKKDARLVPGTMDGFINMVDKGYGSGQILAILLKIIASNNSNPFHRKSRPRLQKVSLVLEEPESNLHPNYQSKLIDMLWDAHHKFSIKFIIECHSEYMIRRLQVLVKNIDLNPDDIAINYFDDSGVTIIEIDKTGYLKSNFGSGFTDESSKLAMDLL